MFRKIANDRPTLLLDEVDAIFGSNTERTEPLRAIINSGNRPGAAVARCVGEGSRQIVKDFCVYCPKVLSGIDTGRSPPRLLPMRGSCLVCVSCEAARCGPAALNELEVAERIRGNSGAQLRCTARVSGGRDRIRNAALRKDIPSQAH